MKGKVLTVEGGQLVLVEETKNPCLVERIFDHK
jgi:hypothetical protein